MRCQSSLRRWKWLAAAGLVILPLFLLAVPALAPASELHFSLSAAWLIGATPDCEDVEPEPHPEAARGRLLARLGVDDWHAAGYRGRGVKIAILDTGFRGYRAHLGGALPAPVATHSFRGDPNLEAKDAQP